MDDPDRIEQGRVAFNRGEYFNAHELWEDAWRELDGAEGILVQGLIQIAAGLHHLQQRRSRPAAGLLRKGLDKLSRSAGRAPISFAHLRIDALAADVTRLLADLDAPGASVPDPTVVDL